MVDFGMRCYVRICTKCLFFVHKCYNWGFISLQPNHRPASEYASPGRPLSCIVDENTPISPANGASCGQTPDPRMAERRVRSQRHRNYMSRTHLHLPPDLPEGYGKSLNFILKAMLSWELLLFYTVSQAILLYYFDNQPCHWSDFPLSTNTVWSAEYFQYCFLFNLSRICSACQSSK